MRMNLVSLRQPMIGPSNLCVRWDQTTVPIMYCNQQQQKKYTALFFSSSTITGEEDVLEHGLLIPHGPALSFYLDTGLWWSSLQIHTRTQFCWRDSQNVCLNDSSVKLLNVYFVASQFEVTEVCRTWRSGNYCTLTGRHNAVVWDLIIGGIFFT